MKGQKERKLIQSRLSVPHYASKFSKWRPLITVMERSDDIEEQFKARPLPQGIITTRTRKALVKPGQERNQSDIGLIWNLVDRTNAFAAYSHIVRKELAKVVQYCANESGAVVIREGEFGSSLYFIINGTVAVEVSTSERGGLIKQVLQEKMIGDSFGEIVTMSGSKKTASIICKTACEFLRVENTDIEEVLRRSYHLETERKMNFLQSLDLFEKWVQSDIKLLNASSKIVEYPANSVIIKDMRQSQDFSFFIMSGNCHVVRQIPVVVERLPFGKEKISLASVDEEDEVKKNMKIDGRYERFKNLYLVIQSLKEGQYFGVDEDIGKSSVITVTKTEFLRIPKSSLQAQQRGSFFTYINSMAMKRYPSRMQTFQKYTIGLKWDSYKKGLVQDITRKRRGRMTAGPNDVPKCLLGH
ncbi:cyclic nucleotide-binding domain-containing protein 2-like isoform X2 [Rhopilema esculentum]|uniref:cyclic nucleotide-binding domain-containing protein 2-like isoform X2 n=1 Tax=Rhopilema esculentum TaxID=499914 RepID=UPI0031CDDF5F